MRLVFAGILLLVLAARADAEPVSVTAEPIGSFQRLSSTAGFGPFIFRGGLTLTSESPVFGGFSGLVLGENCEALLAVNDRGQWLRTRLVYDGDALQGVAGAVMSPIRDSSGRLQRSKPWADAEAVARLADGRIAVGFERRVRFGFYDVEGRGPDALFQPLPHPRDIDQGPENGEVEALGEVPGGRLIAIAERQFDQDGNIRAWLWAGRNVTRFSLTPHDAYEITDLAVHGDEVLTLERRFSASALPGMAVRRFPLTDVAEGKTVTPELLLEATALLHIIDNMEGMALCTREGETRLTLMSDDNFNSPVQSTILLQFAYRR